jgi:hypothetical protein
LQRHQLHDFVNQINGVDFLAVNTDARRSFVWPDESSNGENLTRGLGPAANRKSESKPLSNQKKD